MVKRAKKTQETIVDPRTSPYAGIGLVWTVEGSRGDNYKVRLESFGWQCDCMGFRSHGHCKHITQVDQKLGGDYEDPVYDINLSAVSSVG